MNIPITIQIPKIWAGIFSKTEWNPINYIVGANGTGKSMFSTELKNILTSNGFKVRLLSAERLAGFEKSDYNYITNSQLGNGLNLSYFNEYKMYGSQNGLATEAFILLKERLDLRIKIEAILSDLFKKTIHLSEEGGFLKPKIQNIIGGEEYGIKEQECHGMKEIISLLTFLYDDANNCIIFDEPELHLHPQFQSFFLNEIRKLAGDPKSESGKKLFFIITHSPYFIDIRNLYDLQHILVCHNHQMPTYIKADDLDDQDKYVLKKFIPRFNTHHKQFFFSPNPVFVEGYTDQQIITLLFEKIGLNIAASGSSIIDVGGKDELAVFYKLCNKLNINCRIIADYDAFFRGKLRESICSDENVKSQFINHGFGANVSDCIGMVERLLLKIADRLKEVNSKDEDTKRLVDELQIAYSNVPKDVNRIKDVILLSLYRIKEKLISQVPDIKDDADSLLAKHQQYVDCIKKSNIFIIPNGELEHFFVASPIDYLNITNKDKCFALERDRILEFDNKDEIENKYQKILPLLKESIPHVEIDMLKHIKYSVIEWIQNVQNAIDRGEIRNFGDIQTSARVNYSLYQQILECRESDGLKVEKNGEFRCVIYLKKSIIGEEKKIVFTDKTTAREFKIE